MCQQSKRIHTARNKDKRKEQIIDINWKLGAHEMLLSLCDVTQPAERHFHQLHSVFLSFRVVSGEFDRDKGTGGRGNNGSASYPVSR